MTERRRSHRFNAGILATMVVLVLAGAWILAFRPESRWSDDEAPVGTGFPGGESEAVGGPRPEPVHMSRREYERPASAPKTLRLAGTALFPDKSPAAGVPVRVRAYAGGISAGEPILERVVTTGADGSFSEDAPRPPGLLALSIRPSGGGFAAARELVALVPELAQADPMVLEVHALNELQTVLVTDEAGGPVAGASVELRGIGEPSLTNREGAASLRTSATLPSLPLCVRHPAYAAHEVPLDRVPGAGTGVLRVELRAGGAVEGRVLDSSGLPVARAILRAEPPVCTAVTNEEGRFRLEGLPLDAAGIAIHIAHPEFLPERIVAVPSRESPPVEIRLHRGTSLRGRVLGPDQQALPGATVSLDEHRGETQAKFSTTGESGGFYFPSVGTGAHHLKATYPGLLPAEVRIGVESEGKPVDITLEAGRSLGGRVLDEQLRAIANAVITVEYGTDRVERRTMSDDEGRFLLTALPPGHVDIEVVRPGYSTERKVGVAAGRLNLDVILVAAGGIEGRVEDESGQPVAKFRIRVVSSPDPRVVTSQTSPAPPDALQAGRAFENTAGIFSTTPTPLGRGATYALQVEAPGFEHAVYPNVVAFPLPWRDPLIVRLKRGSVAVGRVVRADNRQPVEGALVAPAGAFADAPTPPKLGAFAVTNAAGDFRIDGLGSAPVSLEIQHPAYVPARTQAATARPGETVHAGEIALLPASAVDVRVNAAVKQRDLSLKVRLRQGSWSETHDLLLYVGRKFPRVPSGELTVSLESSVPELHGLGATLTLEPGEETAVVFEPAGSSSIRGTILVDGAALPGAEVDLSLLRLLTGAEPELVARQPAPVGGQFAVPGVLPGKYRIHAALVHDGVRFAGSLDIELQSGENQVTLKLIPVR